MPLSIVFPRTSFTLLDSVGKKVAAVRDLSSSLNIGNVTPLLYRAADPPSAASSCSSDARSDGNGRRFSGKKPFDVVVGRGVAALPLFCRWALPLLSVGGVVIYIKGGDLEEGLGGVKPEKVITISELCGIQGSEKSAMLFNFASVEKLATTTDGKEKN